MLSNTCKYGIRAVVYIAGNNGKGENIGIKKISEDLELPMPFLAKILQSLAKQKILNSSKGPNGGFSLRKKSDTINLLEVVKAIDGEDVFSKCLLHNDNCKSKDTTKTACTMHGDYVSLRKQIEELFRDKSVQDLVTKAQNSDDILI